MQVAIFGTSYIKDEADAWLVRQWENLTRKLNPDAAIFLIDSASPYPYRFKTKVIRLDGNIGHFSKGGGDGWGRAFITGLELLSERYDWIVHIESDLILVRPVMESMIQPTLDAGMMIGAPIAEQYGFIETGLMCMSSDFISKSGIVAQYEWQRTKNRDYPENRIMQISKPYFQRLMLKGMRAEGNLIDPRAFDYLTHSSISDMKAMILGAGLEIV